jgi:hypothetical protein
VRKFSVVALALLSSLFLWGNVLAVPWVWTDFIDDDQKISRIEPYKYTHTLDHYTPFKDVLFSYDLTISLSDDSACNAVKIDLPGYLGDATSTFSKTFVYESDRYGMSLWGWIQLQTTGQLDVVITSNEGDFNFDYSHLTAYGCESEPYSVAEPSAMMVLGLGLFGLAGCARKRFKG